MRTLPIVALDIDGVLNPDRTQPGYETHDVTLDPADLPASPFVRDAGRKALELSLQTWSVHREWIMGLKGRAEVVWATTWENAANTIYAPLLGVDSLHVAVTVAEHPPKFSMARSGDSAGWKEMALYKSYGAVPMVWIDDSAYQYGGSLEYWGAPSLVIVPDPAIGLTIPQMTQVDEFLDTLEAAR
jgi:hypothetical protein